MNGIKHLCDRIREVHWHLYPDVQSSPEEVMCFEHDGNHTHTFVAL
jgi:hypothetical protein